MKSAHYLFLLVFGFFPLIAWAQPCPDGSFTTSSGGVYCGDATFSFTLEVTSGGDGDFEIDYNDGTPIQTISIPLGTTEVIVHDFMDMVCGNMPGDPIAPTAADPYFIYEIEITRVSCQPVQDATIEIKIVPDPLYGFSVSDTECIDPPYLADFESEVCNAFLVETYTWIVDGQVVGTTPDIEDYEFGAPGSYEVVLIVEDYQGCGSYMETQIIEVTAGPMPLIDLDIDSATLCGPEVLINVTNNSSFTETHLWEANSPNVVFSDPTVAEPVITILNDPPGQSYTITYSAQNSNCPEESVSFTIQTFDSQSVETLPQDACTDIPVSGNELVIFSPPNPAQVCWSGDPSVVFSDPCVPFPEITFTQSGAVNLQLSGEDLCGNPFSTSLTVLVSPSQVFTQTPPDTAICNLITSINLLDYVMPADYIVSCNGLPAPGGCVIDPTGLEGDQTFLLEDSCGQILSLTLTFIGASSFAGGDLSLCLDAECVDLQAIQPGDYSGPGVVGNVFCPTTAGLGNHLINFTDTESDCPGSGSFTVTISDPTAGFDIQTASCLPGDPVFDANDPLTVANSSTAPTHCFSLLSTGQQICAESATFSGLSAGPDTIQQIVGLANGCQDTLLQAIFLEGGYDPLITYDLTADCDGQQASFSVEPGIPDYTYNWTFSNDSASQAINPTVFFQGFPYDTVYQAALLIESFCNSYIFNYDFTIPPAFQVSFGTDSLSNLAGPYCPDELISFANTSTNFDSLFIDYGNGFFSSNDFVSTSYVNNSDSIITYTVTAIGFAAGCPPDTFSLQIEVLPETVNASFNILPIDPACSPLDVIIQDLSTGALQLTLELGDGSSPQPLNNPGDTFAYTYQTSQDTVFNIRLIAEGCGVDTFDVPIAVFASPGIGLLASNDLLCLGDSLNLEALVPGSGGPYSIHWDLGNGTSSFLPEPTVVYADPGDYQVNLTVTSLDNGCISTLSQPVTITAYSGPALEPLVNPLIGCADLEVFFEFPPGIDSLQITFGDGTTAFTAAPHIYAQEGVFMPQFAAWDDLGCPAFASAVIEVLPPIEVQIEADPLLVPLGQVVELYLTSSTTNLIATEWAGSNVPPCPLCTALTVTPLASGDYILTGTDQYGCAGSDTVRVEIYIPEEGNVYIPNAFSPNQDGVNDIFWVFAGPAVEEVEFFRVYDRFGGKIYEGYGAPFTKSQQSGMVGWDGKLQGKYMNPQVFAWEACVRYINGDTDFFKGDVQLVR